MHKKSKINQLHSKLAALNMGTLAYHNAMLCYYARPAFKCVVGYHIRHSTVLVFTVQLDLHFCAQFTLQRKLVLLKVSS